MECHYYIWNHKDKCIQISTNMPSINSLICEIKVKIKTLRLLLSKIKAHVLNDKDERD